jgi:hypothetical protein
MRRHLPLLTGLVLSVVVLAGACALAGWAPRAAGIALFVGVLGSAATEALLWRAPVMWGALRRLQVDATFRAGTRDLVLLGTAVAAKTSGELVGYVITGLAAVWALRVTTVLLQRYCSARRDLAVTWRNVEVPDVRRSQPIGVGALTDAATWPSSGSLPLALGVAATLVTRTHGWVEWGTIVSVAITAGVAVVALLDTFRVRRDSDADQTIDALARALRAHAPEVVLYYSRPEATGYIANVWMSTLEQLPHKVLVLVREQRNANLVDTDVLPVVTIGSAQVLEKVLPPTVQVAMYPSNVAKNNHLIRLPGVFDVFIGHGDSDKGGSATALTRIFDEAWVSGPAARDRYHVADVGVRDDQIREVGRPQLAEIVKHRDPLGESHAGTDGAHPWEYTVLYAPTREGFFASWEYSSIVSQGRTILEVLLSTPGVRVLFKPHPGTGTDDPAFRLEVERLLAMVESAGAPHEVVTGAEGLYQAFNRADLLVSDVSSVITDFLASGKPYVVTNSTLMDADAFRAEFPSATGAYILGGDGSELGGYLEDARTRDGLAQERASTALYLLGDVDEPPVQRFSDAVDAVLAIQRADTARRTRPATPGDASRG